MDFVDGEQGIGTAWAASLSTGQRQHHSQTSDRCHFNRSLPRWSSKDVFQLLCCCSHSRLQLDGCGPMLLLLLLLLLLLPIVTVSQPFSRVDRILQRAGEAMVACHKLIGPIECKLNRPVWDSTLRCSSGPPPLCMLDAQSIMICNIL